MEDAALIESVREFSLLYDKKHRLYKDNIAKENAWQTIGATFGTDGKGKTCEQRWYVLRTKFNTERRRIENVRSGSGDFKIWDLYHQMEFLKNYIATRKTKGNVQTPSVASSEALQTPLVASPPSQNSFLASPTSQNSQVWGEFSVENESVENDFGEAQILEHSRKHLTQSPVLENQIPILKPTTRIIIDNSEQNKTSQSRVAQMKNGTPLLKKKKMNELGTQIQSTWNNFNQYLANKQNNENIDEEKKNYPGDLAFGKSIACSISGLKNERLKNSTEIKILQVIQESLELDVVN